MLSGSRRRSPLMAFIITAATDTDSSRVRPRLQSLPDHDVRRRRRLTQLSDPRLPLNGGQAGLVAGLRRAPATARLHLVPRRLLESTRAQSFRRRRPSARCRVSSRPDHASPAAHARTPRAAAARPARAAPAAARPTIHRPLPCGRDAEKNVAKSSTLAGVRRASSSWAADAAVARRPPRFLAYRLISHKSHGKTLKPVTPHPNPKISPADPLAQARTRPLTTPAHRHLGHPNFTASTEHHTSCTQVTER